MMRGRRRPDARAERPPTAASLDLVCCTVLGGRLAVLVALPGNHDRVTGATLPWFTLPPDAALSTTAGRLARQLFRRPAAWIAQAAALGDRSAHPSTAPLSIAFIAVIPAAAPAPEGFVWASVQSLPPLAARQSAAVTAGLALLRARMDFEPIAFRMLPAEFTLSDLQAMYELLLERRLHKASFRRSLHGAQLVQPTDAWRSEGRGRPAQLYRYSPSKRRGAQRPVRFELLH